MLPIELRLMARDMGIDLPIDDEPLSSNKKRRCDTKKKHRRKMAKQSRRRNRK
jgi:hypothetical protein